MSGHSKWASIKHKKAVTDARRGKLFAKLIRGIEVAAREGRTSMPENDMTLAAAADAGADDVRNTDDGWEIVCDAKEFAKVRKAIEASGLEIDRAELTMLPQTTVPLDASGARPVLRLMDAFEELDDVQGVYTNFDVPDEVLAEVS